MSGTADAQGAASLVASPQDPSMAAGRLPLLCLAMVPALTRWPQAAYQAGRQRFALFVIVAIGLAILVRWPRAALLAAGVTAAGIFAYGGPYLGPRYTVLIVGSGVVGALATDSVRSERWDFLVPPQRAMLPAIVVLLAADVLVVVRTFYLFPVVLIGVSLALTALAMARPDAMARMFAVAETDAAWSRATRAVGRTLRAASVRAHAARVRWWRGDIPTVAALSPEPPREVRLDDDAAQRRTLVDRARAAASRWSLPIAVWGMSFAVVNIFRLTASPLSPTANGLWVHWDTDEYVKIARFGYTYQPGRYLLPDNTGDPIAWMPGYPIAIRALMSLGSNPEAAAVVVSALSGFAVALLMWKWMTQMGIGGRARLLGLLLMLWFPYNFMLFGGGYSDPLFLALCLGAFVLLESDRPILAGLAGAAASLTRINGLGVVAGLALLAVARSKRPRALPRWRYGGVLLAGGGLGGFVVYCWVRFSEPLAYWNAHSALFGHFRFTNTDDLVKAAFFQEVSERFARDPAKMLNLIAGAGLTLLTLALVPYVRRRFGAGYAANNLAVVAIIWCGALDFIGSGRYLTSAFPMAALGGGILADHPRAAGAVLGIFVVFTLVFTYCFTNTINLGW
jgi:hypothetical protein